jgi:hypothetical protein
LKNSVTGAAQYANAATTAGSTILGSFAGLGAQKIATPSNNSAPASPWNKWAPAAFAIGGALLAGAAAGGAYYKRDDLSQGYTWLMEHMKYAGNVWDEPALRRRVDALVDIYEKHGIIFQKYVFSDLPQDCALSAGSFYVQLPETPPAYLTARTFIVQPKRTSREVKHFTPAKNKRASDEVQGHTGMFDAKTNDGYYNLGLVVANVIREAVQTMRTSKLESTSEQGMSM